MTMRLIENRTSSLDIRLFGPFAVCIGGQPLAPLHSRKGHYLLALLTLRHEREVERDWLAGTLWPDSTERQALHNLRQTLSNLRHALGAEAHLLRSPTPHTLFLDFRVRRRIHPSNIILNYRRQRYDTQPFHRATRLMRQRPYSLRPKGA